MPLPQIIGSVIRETRDHLKILPDELAVNARIDAADLKAQEEGRTLLSTAKLGRLAAVLGLDAAALYEGRAVSQPSPGVFFLRTGVPDFFNDDRPLLSAALEASIALVEVDAVLRRPASLRSEFEPAPVGPVPYEDGYHLARLVRKALHNTVDPMGDLRELLEERFDIAVCVAPLRTLRVLAATIKDSPPLIYHPHERGVEDLLTRTREAFAGYRESMQEDRRVLIDRFELKDIAIKVVGVGSVGTFCCVTLLMASEQDPLFLQVKEARSSVLEAYAGKSIHPNHGQRVVNGIRLMQSASDIFLGWTKGKLGRHFYVRQLKDVKVGVQVELLTPGVMIQYAEICGWTLARAHARSGSPAQISGYLGKSDAFDKAVAAFSIAYADQSERDHAILKKAVRAGRVEAVMEPG